MKIIKSEFYDITLAGDLTYTQVNTATSYNRISFINTTGNQLKVKLNNDPDHFGTLLPNGYYDSGPITDKLINDKVDVAGVGTLTIQQQSEKFL